MRRILSIGLGLLLCLSCGRGTKGSSAPAVRPFPQITVPSVYSDPEEMQDYVLAHFFDGFFGGAGLTDSTHMRGVAKNELEQQLSNYISLLDRVPLQKAQKAMGVLFDKTESSDSLTYTLFTQMVARYLYDPNSPLRDEDIYYPFVSRMAVSPMTSEDMKAAYSFEASSCAMNPRGSVAPDFRIRTIRGTTFSMHSVKADYTMLFFSNPGCSACKEIIDAVMGREYVPGMIAAGRLAVVNVYIDEDLEAWRAYEGNYPSSWRTGYDPSGVIRGERLYDVRAIPSLYLLDREKRILMKDAPTEKVLQFIDAVATENK